MTFRGIIQKDCGNKKSSFYSLDGKTFTVAVDHEFFFQAQPRLQLFFGSPNHCATALSMVSALLTGLIAWAVNCRALLGKITLFSSLIIEVVLLWAIAQTFSRGSWVALVVSLLVFFLLVKRAKWLFLILGATFAMLTLMLPAGTSRLESMTSTEDLSITHRLIVWKGAAAIISDHPLFGIGRGDFGKVFSAWYQPLEMNTAYLTALNNVLTIGAEQGVPVLIGYLLLVFLPLATCLTLGYLRQNVGLIAIGSAQCVYHVSAIFTCSLGFWHIALMFWTIYAISLVLSLALLLRSSVDCRTIGGVWLYTFGAACIVPILIACIGTYCAGQLATKVSSIVIPNSTSKAYILQPRNSDPHGLIVYCPDSDESVLDLGKALLRPLSDSGFVIFAIDRPSSGIPGMKLFADFAKIASNHTLPTNLPLYLCGDGEGGRNAILVSGKLSNQNVKGIVSVASEYDSPFAELSVKSHINQINIPILLIHGALDKDTPYSDVVSLAHQTNHSVSIYCISNAGHYFDSTDFKSTSQAIASFTMSSR